MRSLTPLRGEVAPLAYALAAPALLLSQHVTVALIFKWSGVALSPDCGFWLLPFRRLTMMPYLSASVAAAAFAFNLLASWGLAILSFRRARWSRRGHMVAAMSIVPMIQIGAVALLACMPKSASVDQAEPKAGFNVADVTQGVIAGMAIIVLAVLISTVTFGAYGWGLFVLTPFTVGITTAYLANRRSALSLGQTMWLVLAAAALGTVALVMFALEGVVCILLAAPLGAIAAIAGGGLGRAIALSRERRDRPLMSIALLPALFALEGATPPAAPITMDESIDIAAQPSAVWRALTDDEPIGAPPGLVGIAGLAYPICGHLIGSGVGAQRLGIFSTGIARERVTDWIKERRLAFVVVSQPAAMEEMSPYRKVHAPHVLGYFDTRETRFDLRPLAGGGTRLTAHATHILRIDPVPYWEPLARWAIHLNVRRVLDDINAKATASSAGQAKMGIRQRGRG